MKPLPRRDLLRLLAATAAGAAAPLWARGPARYPDPTAEHMLPVPGGRAYVRVNGRLDGPRPPLVCIHGGPGSSPAGLLDLLPLADDRAVILYDQLDSGRSERPGNATNWRVARFVDELEAIRAGLGIARWHVLGHSWGGTIALEYAARRRPELAALVLASPLVSTRSWIADANLLRTRLPGPVQRDLAACERPGPPPQATCKAATEAFYAAYLDREPPTDGLKAYDPRAKRFNDTLYNAMWGPSEFAATGTLKDYDGEPLLAALPAGRTLFLGGQHDEARPATLEAFALRAPGADFAVIPGAAHSLFSDRPAEAQGVLRPWLAARDA